MTSEAALRGLVDLPAEVLMMIKDAIKAPWSTTWERKHAERMKRKTVRSLSKTCRVLRNVFLPHALFELRYASSEDPAIREDLRFLAKHQGYLRDGQFCLLHLPTLTFYGQVSDEDTWPEILPKMKIALKDWRIMQDHDQWLSKYKYHGVGPVREPREFELLTRLCFPSQPSVKDTSSIWPYKRDYV